MAELITVPEPTPEYWVQVLRRWGKKYNEGTMLDWLPLELRTALYRLLFSSYPVCIYLRDNGETVRLSIETERSATAIDFIKESLRTGLQGLIYDLSHEQPPRPVVIDDVEIEPYTNDISRTIVNFAVSLNTASTQRWYSTDCDLCIELLEAFREMLRMVDY